MARPELPEEKRRSVMLRVMLTPVEKTDLQDGADNLGVTMSDLVRTEGLKAARRALKKAPRDSAAE